MGISPHGTKFAEGNPMSSFGREHSIRVLLTGATGFVGSHLYPALVASGCQVTCASRSPENARKRFPDRTWVYMDMDDPSSIAGAMKGCEAAYYLVHRMARGPGSRGGYPARERRGASAFARAAGQVGLQRIVYLGGVAPRQRPSRHLRARLHTGAILRAGPVDTVELRAAMIIGAGSESWRIVRDLAARLPAMLLPRWLRNHSWPVAIDDVVAALIASLSIERGGWFDAPGPERLSHIELLRRAAMVLRRRRPLSLLVPVLTPRLSSYWIGLVSDVDLAMAQELVEGLQSDLDPSSEHIWAHLPGHQPLSVDEAMRRALAEETAAARPAHSGRSR